MSDKRKVEFVRDYVVDDLRKGTADEESYSAGDQVSLNANSAWYFVEARGAAKYLDEGARGRVQQKRRRRKQQSSDEQPDASAGSVSVDAEVAEVPERADAPTVESS